MSNVIFKYRGYLGSAEIVEDDDNLFGKILHISDSVMYEAETKKDLESNFRSAVDEYIEFCEEQGIEPKKTLSGSFNVRIGEDLHRKLNEYAAINSKSNNDALKAILSSALANPEKEINITHSFVFSIAEQYTKKLYRQDFLEGYPSENEEEWQSSLATTNYRSDFGVVN